MNKFIKSSHYRILVIDDNPSIHEDFRKIFSDNTEDKEKEIELLDEMIFDEDKEDKNISNFFQIDAALNAEEGIKLVQKSIENNQPYAIAFVDIYMPPGWDGIETVSRIFQLEPNIQVVLCSAYSDYTWKDMLKKIHHCDRWLLLKKPFDVTEVRQMVLSLCEKWVLELDMKGQIKKKTHQLENMNKKLESQVRELISAKEEIKYLAYYDTLTGLPNRFFFKEMLEQNILEAKRNNSYIGIFFLDLDDFKKINDVFGHTTGDSLLRKVSKRLLNFLRESDFVSRYDEDIKLLSLTSARLGGDEFTIVIKNFNKPESLRKVAERILALIREPFYRITNKEIKITTSIGVALYPTDGKDFVTLLKHADMAMYQAKAHGKNRVNFYDKVLYSAITEKNLLEQDIRTGFDKKEFFLLYQPKFDLITNKIIGSEALLRWKHPERGLLIAEQFVPIAEESDLILELDLWVLKEACSQINAWKNIDFLENMVTSINISGRLFNHPELVHIIHNEINCAGIKAESLELEITESMLMHTDRVTIDHLRELRNLLKHGIKISVDDFGTGYSSLYYLGVLPLDTLKIAQSFIEKIGIDVGQKSIIKAIIDLSHDLNLNVIAEGVETKEQFNFLKKAGCDEVQGYYLAEPMSSNNFIEFVKTWRFK